MTDRERLIELIRQARKLTHNANCDLERAGIFADHLLANGVIVRKQGEWQDNHNGTFTCSVCGGKSSKMKYCGNCGAKLKELNDNACNG